MQRKRADGDFDIFAKSGNFTLQNHTGREVIYHVRKPVSESPIAQLTVNQAITNYDHAESEINFIVVVPGGDGQIRVMSGGVPALLAAGVS